MPNLEYTARLYKMMLLIRQFELRLAEIYHTDAIKSPVHLSVGQEAVAVGVCDPLNKDDIVSNTYRCHATYIAKGGDLNEMMAELYGKQAGCAGGTEMLDALLKKGATVNLQHKSNRSTALYEACSATCTRTYRSIINPDCVRLLLEANADPNLKNDRGETPLMIAAMVVNKEEMPIINMLLNKGAQIKMFAASGDTVLSNATANNNSDVMRTLLQHKDAIDIINQGPSLPYYPGIPLIAAIKRKNSPVIAMILEHKEARIDVRTHEKQTSLMLAAEKDEECAIVLLKELQKRIDNDPSLKSFIDEKDGRARTALHIAATNKHPALVALLLDMQANINHVSTSGNTALHWAFAWLPYDKPRYEKSTDIVRILIDRGIDEKYLVDLPKTVEYDKPPIDQKEFKVYTANLTLAKEALECENQLRFLEKSAFKDMPKAVSQLNLEGLFTFPRRFSPEQVAKRIQINPNLSPEEKTKVESFYANRYWAADGCKALGITGGIRATEAKKAAAEHSRTGSPAKEREIKILPQEKIATIEKVTDRAYQSWLKVNNASVLDAETAFQIATHLLNATDEFVSASARLQKKELSADEKQTLTKEFKEKSSRFMRHAALHGNRPALDYVISAIGSALSSATVNDSTHLNLRSFNREIENLASCFGADQKRDAKADTLFAGTEDAKLNHELRGLKSLLQEQLDEEERDRKHTSSQPARGLDEEMQAEKKRDYEFITAHLLPGIQSILNHLRDNDVNIDERIGRLILWCHHVSDYREHLRTELKMDDVEQQAGLRPS